MSGRRRVGAGDLDVEICRECGGKTLYPSADRARYALLEIKLGRLRAPAQTGHRREQGIRPCPRRPGRYHLTIQPTQY